MTKMVLTLLPPGDRIVRWNSLSRSLGLQRDRWHKNNARVSAASHDRGITPLEVAAVETGDRPHFPPLL